MVLAEKNTLVPEVGLGETGFQHTHARDVLVSEIGAAADQRVEPIPPDPDTVHGPVPCAPSGANAYPVADVEVMDFPGYGLVQVRPIHPGDAERERAFVSDMSDESLRARTLGTLLHVSDDQIRLLVSPDYQSTYALVVADFFTGQFLAVGRLGQWDKPGEVEFAIATLDHLHGRGFGRFLMQRLVRKAKALGYRRFVGDTLYDNVGMLALARALHMNIQPVEGDPSIRQMSLDLQTV